MRKVIRKNFHIIDKKLFRCKKSKKGRICFLIPHHPDEKIGGYEIQTYNIARKLSEKGWEVYFLAITYKQLRMFEEYGVCSILIPGVRMELAFLNFIKLFKFLKLINADIYISGPNTPYTAIVGFFTRLHRKQFLWISAGDMDVSEKRFSKYWFKKERTFFLKKILILIWGKILDSISSWGIKKANVGVALTKYQQNKIRQNFGIPSIVIPVAHEVPLLPKPKIHSKPVIVVWIANIKSVKRPLLFIKLAQECLDLEAKFLMIGYIQESQLSRLISYYNSRLKNFHYLGGQDYKNVMEILNNADILVNTSEAEGFPSTFVEAWMRGVPVLSLAIDPDGYIKQYKLGFCSEGNWKEFVARGRDLINNPTLRRNLGLNAREFARKNFTLNSIAEKYNDLLKALQFHGLKRQFLK